MWRPSLRLVVGSTIVLALIALAVSAGGPTRFDQVYSLYPDKIGSYYAVKTATFYIDSLGSTAADSITKRTMAVWTLYRGITVLRMDVFCRDSLYKDTLLVQLKSGSDSAYVTCAQPYVTGNPASSTTTKAFATAQKCTLQVANADAAGRPCNGKRVTVTVHYTDY